VGMSEKRSSSYSSSLIASIASFARGGFSAGGNFPLFSHDSEKCTNLADLFPKVIYIYPRRTFSDELS